jgi:Signal transduction histidine kinase
LSQESPIQYDANDPHHPHPITIPTDIPGILYPTHAFSMGTDDSIESNHTTPPASPYDEELTNGTDDQLGQYEILYRGREGRRVRSQIFENLHDLPDTPALVEGKQNQNQQNQNPLRDISPQKRFALVYNDNNYKTLKELYYEDQPPFSDTPILVQSDLEAAITLNTPSSIKSGASSRIIPESEEKKKIQSPLRFIEIITDICKVLETLGVVHELGVVHNGITSSNILKSEDYADDVKLTGWDFSFSIQPEDCSNTYRKRHLTQVPELIPYLSPEVSGELFKGVDYRSDFYSIGIVLYELLVGRLPFQSDTPSKLVRMHILQKPIAPILLAHKIPENLNDILLKLLEKDPNDRYTDCYSVIHELSAVKNAFISNIEITDLDSKYSLSEPYLKHYLTKMEPIHEDKCGIPPCYVYPRGIYGRTEIYDRIVEKYNSLVVGIGVIFVTGKSGTGKTTLINDLRVSAITKYDFFFLWKFNKNESNHSLYTCFVHGFKTIINQILASSQANIAKWRDLLISKIPLDLSILFFLIPELKQLLGPKYSSLFKSSDPNTKKNSTSNLELKFRYIMKVFFCLIGTQGLTIFFDDVHWSSPSEWKMVSDILEFIKANELEEHSSVKIVCSYENDIDPGIAKNLSKEVLLEHLKSSLAECYEFELNDLGIEEFSQFVKATFFVGPSGCGSSKLYNQCETTSLSAMQTNSDQQDACLLNLDERSKRFVNRLFEYTKGNILHARYIISSSAFLGQLRFEFNKANNQRRWYLEFADDLAIDQPISKRFLSVVLDRDSKSLLKFAAIVTNGYYFHLSDLMIVSNLPIKRVYLLLHFCVQIKVIVPTSTYYKIPFHLMTDDFPFDLSDSNIWELTTQARFKFFHDSIQYELIEELENDSAFEEYHRLCGLRYYKRISKQTDFSIANYLQMAQHLRNSWKVAKPEEKEIYLEVLIQAGRYASATYNLKTSLAFFVAADELIDTSDIKLKLKSVVTICHNYFALQQYQECLDFIEQAQENYGFDENIFLLSRVRSLIQSGQHERGLKTAVVGLQKLGMEVSLDANKLKLLYEKAINKVPLSIPEIRKLKNLKQATNPVVLLTYELISDIIAPSYVASYDYLRKYLVAKLVMLMNSHGISAYCAIPLLDFANSFAKLYDKGSFMKAVEFSKLALHLVSTADNISFAYVQTVYEYYINTLAPFVEPIADIMKYYEVFVSSTSSFSKSHPGHMDCLTDISRFRLSQLTGYTYGSLVNNSTKLQFSESFSMGDVQLNGFALLKGEITLDEFEKRCNPENETREYRFGYYANKMRYLAVNREDQGAGEIIFKAYPLLQELPNTVIHMRFYFISCAVLLSYQPADEKEKAMCDMIMDNNFKQFQIWNEAFPLTFKSKFDTIQAFSLIYHKTGTSLEILDLFEEAVEYATDNNNWYDAGWSSLFCAEWLNRESLGNKRASHFARIALDAFKILDMAMFVQLIEKKLVVETGYNWAGLKDSQQLVNKVTFRKNEGDKPLGSTLKSFFLESPVVKITPESEESKLMRESKSLSLDKIDTSNDLNKAVEACLLISESSDDIIIVQKLLESAILFSEVDYGVVVSWGSNEPMIKAIGSSNNVYSLDQSLSSRADICPFSLIMHTLHSGEIVNKDEDHISFGNRFGKDEYYKTNQCSAMICMPLKGPSGVFGALYLENQKPVLTSLPFFNPRKRDLLDLLCTQAAVSLGKAKLYTQMEVAKQAAEEATAEKASFLANMSHEIRTPFNSLLSCSIFLLDTNLTKTQQEYVETIKSSAMVTLNIIDGILAFSKIEHGSFTLDNGYFSLNECIESSIQLSGEQAAVNDLELVFFNRCPQIKSIEGDLTRFRQIIINLVGNALKFTSSGSILVESTAKEITDDRYEITITVKDTGIGIPDESKNKVFGAFSQVDGSSRREYGGSGLGLAISKKLSDMMGGSLGFESKEGVGSTFHFIVNSQVEKYDKPEVYFELDKGKENGMSNKALVINELEYSRQSLKETLEYFGMDITVINNLSEIRQNIDEFSIIFIHESQYANFQKFSKLVSKECKVVVIAQFGRSLPKDIGDHEVLIAPFQRQKVTRLIDNVVNGIEEERKSPEENKTLAERYPLRILLAEDNFINTKVALQHLKKLGYKADHSKDGVEVLKMCNELLEKSESYDIILMDIQMPQKDGFAATLELHELFETRQDVTMPQIVALTANVAGDDREKSLKCGMVDFISKPIIPSDLIRVLTCMGTKLEKEKL